MCAGPRTMTCRCECQDACGPRLSAVGPMLQTSALWAWRLPRGLEHASHVLGRALWHALALTDASPRAPQVCSTSREDKRTGFTVPPQTTREAARGRVLTRVTERNRLPLRAGVAVRALRAWRGTERRRCDEGRRGKESCRERGEKQTPVARGSSSVCKKS